MVIETSIPTIDEEMEKELLRALREEMLVGGKSVELFEQEFARFVGSQYAVAVNSGQTHCLLLFDVWVSLEKSSRHLCHLLQQQKVLFLVVHARHLLISIQTHGISMLRK